MICEECQTPLVRRKLGESKSKFATRKFCSCKCQAINREKQFRITLGGKRLFRRTVDNNQLIAAMAMVASGEFTLQEAAASSGFGHQTLVNRMIELGYKPERRNRLWPKAKLVLPSNIAHLGYIAGIIDGEGSITFSRRPPTRWIIHITNTDLTLMKWLAQLGGSFQPRKFSSRLSSTPKQCYTWHLQSRRDVLLLLSAIEPYLIIKRHLAVQAIRKITAEVEERKTLKKAIFVDMASKLGLNLTQIEAQMSALRA